MEAITRSFMLRLFYLCLFIKLLVGTAFAADSILPKTNASAGRGSSEWHEVWGAWTNNLTPYINFFPSSGGWDIAISYIAQIDYMAHAWLNITNRVGAKLELWQTNGTRLISKSADVLEAFQLPKQALVSEIIYHSAYPRNKRGYQWWRTGGAIKAGSGGIATEFSLESMFNICATNDYVIQISPLMYRVGINSANAHLVEFAPIKIKLKSNGDVEKLE